MIREPHALLIAHQYWPTPGAASQVLGALVRELVGQGFRVSVFTNAAIPGTRGASTGPHGEQVLSVSEPETSGVSLKRIRDLARFARASLRRSRPGKYDIVISDAPPTAAWAAARIAKRQGVPFVYYFSDSWAAASQGSRSALGRILNRTIAAIENRALRASRLAVAVTSEMVEIARAAGAPRVIEVHNGIDTQQAQASDVAWYPGVSGRPFFLYAGNAGVVHGAEVFVDAAEILWQSGHEFDLVFMGYGIGQAYARAAQERWPDYVWVLENQPPEIVTAAFRTAAGALSSLRTLPAYAHARPMKSLTGAACGTPAVYAGEGDFADVIRENGLGFVGSWDAEAVASCMTLALELDASDSRDLVRQRIRDYAAAEFDERAGARTVVQVIQQVLRAATSHGSRTEALGDR